MLNGSTLIKGRWKILRKIGAGAFGEIYAGKNIITSQQVAIKVERADSKKQVLKLEVAVLKKVQGAPYVCQFITCGRSGDYNFLVMELLGENLSELRRRQAGPAAIAAGNDGKFSMLTTLKLGTVFIKALQQIHDHGYIHRDVKPSNFVVGRTPQTLGMVYIIDFGLARKYLGPNGEIKSSRDQTGFRGTARYASIQSHLCQDLGRRDDLWSVLYILIEFAKGNLPWRKLKDKEKIGEMKVKMNGPELVAGLPTEFLQFMDHLQTLEYGDRPDYEFLVELLQSRFEKLGGDEGALYDWQLATSPIAGDLLDRANSAGAPVAAHSDRELSGADGAGGPASPTPPYPGASSALSSSANYGLSPPVSENLPPSNQPPSMKLVANKKLGNSGHATNVYNYAATTVNATNNGHKGEDHPRHGSESVSKSSHREPALSPDDVSVEGGVMPDSSEDEDNPNAVKMRRTHASKPKTPENPEADPKNPKTKQMHTNNVVGLMEEDSTSSIEEKKIPPSTTKKTAGKNDHSELSVGKHSATGDTTTCCVKCSIM